MKPRCKQSLIYKNLIAGIKNSGGKGAAAELPASSSWGSSKAKESWDQQLVGLRKRTYLLEPHNYRALTNKLNLNVCVLFVILAYRFRLAVAVLKRNSK